MASILSDTKHWKNSLALLLKPSWISVLQWILYKWAGSQISSWLHKRNSSNKRFSGWKLELESKKKKSNTKQTTHWRTPNCIWLSYFIIHLVFPQQTAMKWHNIFSVQHNMVNSIWHQIFILGIYKKGKEKRTGFKKFEGRGTSLLMVQLQLKMPFPKPRNPHWLASLYSLEMYHRPLGWWSPDSLTVHAALLHPLEPNCYSRSPPQSKNLLLPSPEIT